MESMRPSSYARSRLPSGTSRHRTPAGAFAQAGSTSRKGNQLNCRGKRRERQTVLTVEEYETILSLLREPARTMVTVAQCLGLRVSQIAALQWDDSILKRTNCSFNEAA